MNLREYLKTLSRPEPSGGLDYYNGIIADGLKKYPERKRNFEKYKLYERTNSEIDFLPIKLDIENVSRCNLACTMCIVSTWDKQTRARDMTVDEFKSLINQQFGLTEIKLNGLGEPLLAKDDLFEMIKYARSKDIWVRLTTNSTLLHLKDNYKKLIDSDVNEIDISVDGANKETYEKIRVGGKFEMVKKNCKLLNDYAESKGIIRTKMWTLVQAGNYQDLHNHIKLAKEINFKKVVFSLELHGWGNDDLFEENKKKSVKDFLTIAYVKDLSELAKSLQIELYFWDVSDKFSNKSKESLCPWPFQRAVITSDSRVVPCCMIADPNAYEIGKGKNKSFKDIWFSDEYKKFRNDHIEGKIPEICKNCYEK